jgi:hypothetical protein
MLEKLRLVVSTRNHRVSLKFVKDNINLVAKLAVRIGLNLGVSVNSKLTFNYKTL